MSSTPLSPSFFFFFNDTATTEIYTLSLHDALPISGDDDEATLHERIKVAERALLVATAGRMVREGWSVQGRKVRVGDRKSTRLNSSHGYISYAVFCLKKKKKTQKRRARARVQHTRT